MQDSDALNLFSTHLRLRPDVSIEALPVDDTFWQRLGAGQLGDFHHEYLVTCHEFTTDWLMWEMHSAGDEVVCLLSGAVEFILEFPEGNRHVCTAWAASCWCRRARGTRHAPA